MTEQYSPAEHFEKLKERVRHEIAVSDQRLEDVITRCSTINSGIATNLGECHQSLEGLSELTPFNASKLDGFLKQFPSNEQTEQLRNEANAVILGVDALKEFLDDVLGERFTDEHQEYLRKMTSQLTKAWTQYESSLQTVLGT